MHSELSEKLTVTGRRALLVVALVLIGWLVAIQWDEDPGTAVVVRPSPEQAGLASDIAPLVAEDSPLVAKPAPLRTEGAPTKIAPAPLISLRVEHADGRPATGGRVLFGDDPDRKPFAWTDEPIPLAPGDLRAGVSLAGLSDDLVRVEPIEENQGQWLATLPAGGVVTGYVTVDGEAPPVPLHVTLARSRPRLPTWESLNDRWRLALALPRSGLWGDDQFAAQRVAPDGSFSFSGLPEGWKGRLHFPDRYVVKRRWGQVSLPSPVEGYHLELSTCPTIQARLWMPDGSPAAAGTVRSTLVTTFNRLDGPSAVADGEGHVGLPSGWSPGLQALLSFTSADGTAVAGRTVSTAHRLQGVDLGDVQLDALSPMTLRVVDERGAPVPGAIAVPPDGDGGWDAGRRSAPTDDTGLTVVGLTSSDERINVLSFEHSTATISLPAAATSEPQEVVLSGCASLELAWASDDFEPSTWVIRSDTPLLEGSADFTVSDERRAVGGSAPAMRSVQTDRSVSPARVGGTVRYDAGNGPVRLSCLTDNVFFDVQLLGAADEVLWSREDVVLPPEGVTRMVADLSDLAIQAVAGLVTDDDGRPLADAAVYVGPAGVEPLRSVTTDGEGRFRLEVAVSGPIRIEVTKAGFTTKVIDPAPTSLRVTLEAQ